MKCIDQIYQGLKIQSIGLLSLYAFMPIASAQDDAKKEELSSVDASPQIARELVEQWLDVERTLSHEKSEWLVQKEHGEEMKKLYQAELDLIETELNAAGDAYKVDQAKIDELERFVKKSSTERAKLRERLVKQIEDTQMLYMLFPEVLQTSLLSEYKVLADDELDLRGDVMALTNILKGAVKFNNTVTYAEEFHEVAGVERQLQILYWGLGAAYYISGDTAGRGKFSDGGWKWSEDSAVFSETSRAIAIYQKTARPDLVKLPVEVK